MNSTQNNKPKQTGIVCVTGSCGGLGRSFAERFAAEGCELLLIDKDRDALKKTVECLQQQYNVRVEGWAIDLSDRQEVLGLTKRLTKIGYISTLINNAGFGLPGGFTEVSLEQQLAMIDLHVCATTMLCRAVLPAMQEKSCGNIINVASLGGFRPSGTQITYGSTKRYCIHFSRSLNEEFKSSGIKVQVLCPGFVRTGFHSTAEYKQQGAPKIPPLFWMSPEKVVTTSLRALQNGRIVCIPGISSYMLLLFSCNPLLWRLVCGVARRFPRSLSENALFP